MWSATLEQGHLFRYDCQSPQSSETALFEREFAERVGARYAVAVNSCSSALFLALLASGVRPGDEVLLPAFTFIAVPSAVVHAGATPVLVEMTGDLAIDPDDLERKISDRTSALLLSYMRGHVPDLERVLEICAGRGIVVIEDVAHGMGVQWDGVPLGRFGRASAFSFQSYKLMDGGEGGMLVTDDREVALRALLQAGCYDRNWRLHFLPEDDLAWLEAAVNSLPAFGLRMSNLTASALRPQMARIDDRVASHRDRYLQVVAELADCPIRLPAHSDRVRPAPDSLQFEVPTLAPRPARAIRCALQRAGSPAAGLRARPGEFPLLLELALHRVRGLSPHARPALSARGRAAAAVARRPESGSLRRRDPHRPGRGGCRIRRCRRRSWRGVAPRSPPARGQRAAPPRSRR